MLNIRSKIENKAKEIGFDLIGFSKPILDKKYISSYKNWIENNFHAGMDYMEKNECRENIDIIMPNTKTVICLAVNYFYIQNELLPTFKRVARYAYGRDYHKIIPKMTKQLEEEIKRILPNCTTKSFIDTAPILERAYAEQAGIGYIGKNSMLITKEFGSFVFLTEILIDQDLLDENYKTPEINISCGTCTKCIDSCPTNAISKSRSIDSNKCISYLTIENRGEINKNLKEIISEENIIFGCDICQNVCPHNCRAKEHNHINLKVPQIAGDQISTEEIDNLKTNEEFIKRFAGSAVIRSKFNGIKRNSSMYN